VRSSRRIGGSSSTTRTVSALAMRQGDAALGFDLGHHRHADRQDGARPVTTVARDDPAAERLDKAAADRKTEAGSRTPMVLRLNPVEFVENALKIAGRDPRPLVD